MNLALRAPKVPDMGPAALVLGNLSKKGHCPWSVMLGLFISLEPSIYVCVLASKLLLIPHPSSG